MNNTSIFTSFTFVVCWATAFMAALNFGQIHNLQENFKQVQPAVINYYNQLVDQALARKERNLASINDTREVCLNGFVYITNGMSAEPVQALGYSKLNRVPCIKEEEINEYVQKIEKLKK